jgi:molybdate/tungstate transport system permease protein
MTRSADSTLPLSLAILLGVPALVLLLFLLLPIATIVLLTGPERLWQTLVEPAVLRSVLLTVGAAVTATGAALALGVPLAFLLARARFPGKALIAAAIDLPLVIPHTAAGVALLLAFGRHAPVGSALHALGVSFTGSPVGIACAMAFVSAPYLIGAARDAFLRIDPPLERVAATLGATPWQVFRHVSLPLASRGIATGVVQMWARGVSEFGAIMIIAYHPMVVPVLLWDRFETYGLEHAQPLAALMVLVSVLLFLAVRVVASRLPGPEAAR